MPTLTKEQFQAVLPIKMKKSVSTDLINEINLILQDPETLDSFKDDLLGYAQVLNSGKYKLTSYINAVKFVSYKLLGDTNIVAFAKTFPDRYNDLVTSNKSNKEIGTYASAYNTSKLVTEIMRQTLVPIYIVNQPAVQEAINTQIDIMRTSTSDKCRVDAANSILTHLKQPEDTNLNLNIGINKGSIIDNLEDAMHRLVAKQKEVILNGGDVKQIANMPITIKQEEPEDEGV
jgi:hypothetical protein